VGILLPPTGALELDVALEALPAHLARVHVFGRSGDSGRVDATELVRPIGTRTLSDADVRRDPRLADADFLLAAGSAGGDVAIPPESPAALHVRGGASDQNLVLIDGVPVYSPAHGSFAAGALLPDALRTVALHGGVAPARLGGALSGVIEARTRDPGGDGMRVSGALGLASARLAAEGAIAGTGARYLLGGRLGAPGLVPAEADDARLTGASSDALAKATLPLAGGALELISLSVADRASFAARPRGDEPGARARRHGFEWGSHSHGASWRSAPDDAAPVSVRLWQASYEAEVAWSGESAPLWITSERTTDGLRGEVAADGDGRRLRAGVELERHRVSYRVRGAAGSDETEPGAALRGELVAIAAFVDEERRLGERWEAMLGVRGALLHGAPVLEPRVILRHRPHRSTSFAFGYARTHQVAQSLRNPESLVRAVFGADLPVLAGMRAAPVASADQIAGAIESEPAAGLRFSLDGYVRRLRGVVLVAPADARPFAADGFVVGTGSVAGAALDVAWERGAITARGSLGAQSVETIVRGGSYQPGHAASRTLSAGVAFRPSPRTTLRAALFASSGRRTTPFEGPLDWEGCNPLDGGCEVVGAPERAAGSPGAVRLPPYVRLDLGARRTWTVRVLGRPAALEGHLTLSNVLDRRNVWGVIEDGDGVPRLVPVRPFAVLDAGIGWRW
jgi:hypothetical protein